MTFEEWSREQFEAWIKGKPWFFTALLARENAPPKYDYESAEDRWQVWQAALKVGAEAQRERDAEATRCYKCEAEIRALRIEGAAK